MGLREMEFKNLSQHFIDIFIPLPFMPPSHNVRNESRTAVTKNRIIDFYCTVKPLSINILFYLASLQLTREI